MLPLLLAPRLLNSLNAPSRRRDTKIDNTKKSSWMCGLWLKLVKMIKLHQKLPLCRVYRQFPFPRRSEIQFSQIPEHPPRQKFIYPGSNDAVRAQSGLAIIRVKRH